VVGVYGLVGLGLLWLMERYEVTPRRILAWLRRAAKQRDFEAEVDAPVGVLGGTVEPQRADYSEDSLDPNDRGGGMVRPLGS
jgi:hypothetical protein